MPEVNDERAATTDAKDTANTDDGHSTTTVRMATANRGDGPICSCGIGELTLEEPTTADADEKLPKKG